MLVFQKHYHLHTSGGRGVIDIPACNGGTPEDQNQRKEGTGLDSRSFHSLHHAHPFLRHRDPDRAGRERNRKRHITEQHREHCKKHIDSSCRPQRIPQKYIH